MKIILEGSELVLNKFLKVQRTYIKRKGISIVEAEELKPIVDVEELELLSELYFEKFDKKVPNNKARNIEWIKEKLNG